MLELNKLYNENCLDTMRRIERHTVDMIITSPPYDNLRTYEDKSNFSFEVFKECVKQFYRILKVGGVIVWVVGDQVIRYNNGTGESGSSFKQALYFIEAGFCLFDTMIYRKNGMQFPDPLRYYQEFEYMFVISKGKPKTINRLKDRVNKRAGAKVHGAARQKDGSFKLRSCDGLNRRIEEFGIRFNIWKIKKTEFKAKDRWLTKHPAMFPSVLVRDHLLSWSSEGDLIYDPFMGSGTTGSECRKLNRNFIGSEINENYFEIANKRIQELI